MLRSMISAASALRFHQTFMDVVANNIANVNTTAFKSSRVSFQEMMNQVISSGTGPDLAAGRGGINPVQIGLGMTLGGVDTLFTQGGLQSTGRTSDLAIQGEGFFIFQGPNNRQLYSRDGTLDIATDGRLVNPHTGLPILGWQADANGNIDPTTPLTVITIGLGSTVTANPTSSVVFRGNLRSSAPIGPDSQTRVTFEVYDSMGTSHYITLTFEKTANNTWSITPSENDPDMAITSPLPANLVFDAQGNVASGGTPSLTITLSNGANTPQTINLDLTSLTQLADLSEVRAVSQDGNAAGALVGFDVATSGIVMGVYSNGLRQAVGQIALATFRNPAGLIKEGQNLYSESANTGARTVGVAGTGERGQINAGYLEMSNVDLATQFTDMIRAQRGFQANSRVISASDQMLQELVNIVR
ncbi:MAG: flagellar hook protein FlgE [Anaerolineae bacterium]|nr:flagellar hook protein FlgE [Anaerolineae bacterium]MDW8099711.1 flagellar hook protein FlgE [Anaerolineae bacterium]